MPDVNVIEVNFRRTRRTTIGATVDEIEAIGEELFNLRDDLLTALHSRVEECEQLRSVHVEPSRSFSRNDAARSLRMRRCSTRCAPCTRVSRCRGNRSLRRCLGASRRTTRRFVRGTR